MIFNRLPTELTPSIDEYWNTQQALDCAFGSSAAMSENAAKSSLIWVISTKPQYFASLQHSVPKEVQRCFKVVTLAYAVAEIRSHHLPHCVFIQGAPIREGQAIFTELKSIAPEIPVFLIMSWESEGEMRSWISRLVIDSVQPTSPALDNSFNNSYDLSKRELQILRFMVQGLIKKEIAEQLAISYHTVNNHECNIFRKLQVHTRSAAVAKALMERIC